MSSYLSLSALKDAVGLTDTVDDSVLTSCIVRASAAVDGFLGQNRIGYVGFADSSNSRTSVGSNTRVYDGDGTDTLWIDDASSVATVSVDGTAVDADDFHLWPRNHTPKRAIIYDRPSYLIPTLSITHWPTQGEVSVTGYWGLDHVPSDVEQTVLAIALVYWRRQQQGEPEPVVTPRGSRGFIIDDPEIGGLLVAGLQGWVSHGVFGA